MIQTVAIVGVGLIGGSFALALRKAGFQGELLGVSSREAIEVALERQAISRESTLGEAAREADLIYLAQPVDRILNTLLELGRIARSNCLITDAGSAKQAIVEQAASAGLATRFLGGHPMAGKETTGVAAAEADLFHHRPYVIMPGCEGNAHKIEFLKWLDEIGANVIEMSAEQHDRTVAFTSHLPQIISTALALTLAENKDKYDSRIFGPGLLDMTRLAMSAPHLWNGILANNLIPVSNAINDFSISLEKLRSAAAIGHLDRFFAVAAEWSHSTKESKST